MLSNYKDTLEKLDPEAVKSLIKFNRKEFLEKFYEDLPWYKKFFSLAPKNY